ncbi:Molybdopterin-synthase adenylyltransferase [hydrothermal vent metagenome]|uniref:Molybdopterin-synthase adenylyltransferase n=1 Tax=hydrothermal vent metagenome TaxID=652676 RepID=A0A3B0T389_9ZZZZ
MNEQRYTRQTTLKDFGEEGQQKLTEAKVLVVGAGGLGVPVMTYLNGMGVGTIGIVDDDVVSLTNLHRQVLYTEANVGKAKVASAIKTLQLQNSATELIGHETFLSVENALSIIQAYDIIVDATDNFPTRYLINDASVILRKPFVYGALHGYEGQVSVFNHNEGSTYRCLFPDMPKEDEVPNCNEHGVLGIIPGIVGNLQALETVKLITGVGDVLSGELLLYNGLSQTLQKIRFKPLPANRKITKLLASYEFSCRTALQSIDSDAFEKLLANENIQIVDVRTETEYSVIHLKNSVNIPLADLETRIDELPLNAPIYFICQSGIRSRKAILTLQNAKLKEDLINVSGGMNNLKNHVAEY